MAPSSLSRRRRRPPRCAVGARSLNSNRCHVDNRRVLPAKWHVYGRHVYKLLLEVPAQRQHVRVAPLWRSEPNTRWAWRLIRTLQVALGWRWKRPQNERRPMASAPRDGN